MPNNALIEGENKFLGGKPNNKGGTKFQKNYWKNLNNPKY